MADHETNDNSHDEDHDGHGGIGKYLAVTAGLLVLTLISFVIGNTPAIMQTPSIGWTGMIAVSCAKASLVILFFMHLKWEANWKYVLTIPASIMSIFLMLMLVPDVGRRSNRYSETRWLHSADPFTDADELPSSDQDATEPESADDGQ